MQAVFENCGATAATTESPAIWRGELTNSSKNIRSMVDLAYQELGVAVQERFAVQHFIDALYDKDDRLYLRREKPETLDQALSLARELESLRVLDNNNSFRRADCKVRAMETERMQLQIKVDELKRQIDYQQQQLEA